MRYARVRDGEAYQSLSIGDVAELGRDAQMRREITHEIVEQAGANGGIYSNSQHRDHLLDTRADGDAAWEQARAKANMAEQLVEACARRPGTGIGRTDGGDYEVDVAEFGKFMGKQAEREAASGITDVNNVTLELEQGRDLDMDR